MFDSKTDIQHRGWLTKCSEKSSKWKKRFCTIENGVLYYYVSPSDRESGKAALGALVLRNAAARRPTDLAHKGKYKDTCFRVDLDSAEQATLVASVAPAACASASASERSSSRTPELAPCVHAGSAPAHSSALPALTSGTAVTASSSTVSFVCSLLACSVCEACASAVAGAETAAVGLNGTGSQLEPSWPPNPQSAVPL